MNHWGKKGGRVLQGEITASVKALWWECARCVQARARRPVCEANAGIGVKLEEVARSQLIQGPWAMTGTLDIF